RIPLGDGTKGLQQDGGLADAGVAADQHHRAFYQTAAKYTVQFAGGGGEARYFLDADFSQGLDIRLVARPAGTAAGWRSTLDDGFRQGVPGPAVATLPGPLGKGRAALGAAVDALGLGHGNSRVGKGSCMIAA